MGRAKKFLIFGAGFIILLLAAAAIFLKVYFTKERVMALIIPPLEKKLARRVSLKDAGAGLSGFYLTGLDIQKEGEPLPLLKVEKVALGWDFRALLERRVALGEVSLIGPEIALFKDKTGRLSIHDLISPEKKPEEAKPPEAEPESKKAAALVVTIKRVVLKRGVFFFRDETKSPARIWRVSNIDFKASDFSLERPFPYNLGAEVTVGRPFKVTLDGTFNPKDQGVDAVLKIAGVELAPVLEALSGSADPVNAGKFGLYANLRIDPSRNLDLAANATIDGLKLKSSSGLTKPINLGLDLKARAALPPKKIEIENLRMVVNGQRIDGKGVFQIGNSPHQVNLAVGSKSLDIDELLSVFPKEEAKQPEEKEGPAPAEKRVSEKKPPVIKRPPVRGKVSLSVERLKVKNVVATGLNAILWLKDAGLYVEPLYGDLYNGKFNAKAEALYDLPGPPFTGQIELDGTSLSPLVKALAPDMKGDLTGTMSATGNAKGKGGDLASLDSKLKLTVTDGKLVNHVAVERMAKLFRTDELKEILFDRLFADCSTAYGVATVNRLTMTGPHLRLAGHAAIGLLDKKLNGKLTIKVPKRWANNIIPIDTVLDEISEEPGWPALPVLVSGTTKEPSFDVDPQWLAKKTVGVVERGVKDVIKGSGKGVKDIGEGIEEGIKKGLKGLKDNLPFFR